MASNKDSNNPSEQQQKEIEQRLAALTGRDPSYYSSTEPPVKILSLNTNRKADGTRKTDIDIADDLLHQIVGELKLDQQREDSGSQVDRLIEQRLSSLKQFTKASLNSIPSKLTHSSSQTQGKHEQLIQQILSEPDDDAEEPAMDTDDDPCDWCVTCNENATIVCVDCDDDVYCAPCFR